MRLTSTTSAALAGNSARANVAAAADWLIRLMQLSEATRHAHDLLHELGRRGRPLQGDLSWWLLALGHVVT